MYLIKKRYKKNVLNVLLSTSFLFWFCYVIIAADKYSIQEKFNWVNAAFLQIKDYQDEWYISLDNVAIFDDSDSGKFTYIVQPWDTLSSISTKFWTTVSHLKNINSLKKNSVKIWDKLVISEQDWIIYDMPESTNLKDFAAKYKLSLDDLMELNYISDPNYVVEKEEEIFIPITEDQARNIWLIKVVQPPVVQTPIAKATTKNTGKTTSKTTTKKAATPSTTRYSSSGGSSTVSRWYYNPSVRNWFSRGYCTRYVAIKKFPYASDGKQKRLWGGNAISWYSNAKAAGYSVGKTARNGAIVVFSSAGWRYSGYWHVWIVIDIDYKNNKILVEDMNAAWRFVVTRRWVGINSSIIWYIYM